MKFTARSTALAAELRLLSRVAPTKTTIPALAYALVRASHADALDLAATDLGVTLSTRCAARVERQGEGTLPVKRTLDLLDQIADADVIIEVDETGHVRIESGAFKSRIQAISAGDFPTLPAVEGTAATLGAVSLKLLIERTLYAVGDPGQKYVIDGALLSLAGTVAAMVATDGKRLTVATASRPDGVALTALVPSKTLGVLSPLLEEGDVEVSVGERHLFFGCGHRVLTSRMLESQFPKYDRVIPRDCDKHATVDRAALAEALRRVVVVAGDKDDVFFELGAGEVQLSGRGAGIGEAAEGVPAEYAGDAIKVCAGGRHVLDFLERASSKTVKLSMKTEISPLLLTDGASDFINVVLVRRQ